MILVPSRTYPVIMSLLDKLVESYGIACTGLTFGFGFPAEMQRGLRFR
jgi:hypothetical protein